MLGGEGGCARLIVQPFSALGGDDGIVLGAPFLWGVVSCAELEPELVELELELGIVNVSSHY